MHKKNFAVFVFVAVKLKNLELYFPLLFFLKF